MSQGSYTIQLADGRVRTVSYVADENGFRPSISTNELGESDCLVELEHKCASRVNASGKFEIMERNNNAPCQQEPRASPPPIPFSSLLPSPERKLQSNTDLSMSLVD